MIVVSTEGPVIMSRLISAGAKRSSDGERECVKNLADLFTADMNDAGR